MIKEGEVIAAVAELLKNDGYCIEQLCTTKQRGIDIIAVRKKRRMLVEAKGGTSSLESSSRYGEPFNGGQAKVHVSAAFYSAARLRQEHASARVAMAFPDDESHHKRVNAIQSAIDDLGIIVFFVAADGKVKQRKKRRRTNAAKRL